MMSKQNNLQGLVSSPAFSRKQLNPKQRNIFCFVVKKSPLTHQLLSFIFLFSRTAPGESWYSRSKGSWRGRGWTERGHQGVDWKKKERREEGLVLDQPGESEGKRSRAASRGTISRGWSLRRSLQEQTTTGHAAFCFTISLQSSFSSRTQRAAGKKVPRKPRSSSFNETYRRYT